MFSILVTGAAAVLLLWHADHMPPGVVLLPLFLLACSSLSMRSLFFLRRVRAELARVKGAPVPPLAFPAGDEPANQAEVQH
ncbi:hypothetical protein [Massilia pseudoviolaceinigra]|uniref:hypothetical protein n=1 Tax=Massilia pseudoviolaceinigra TaxID=3057165 RepID=UPI002796A6B7|nr:hypothetical protein [Massilia sp. CCM 9206]MDQ1925017.1 hypothetical protein [Massilia sp. CCM 9206]